MKIGNDELNVRKESQVGGEGEDLHGTGPLSWGRPWYVLGRGADIY